MEQYEMKSKSKKNRHYGEGSFKLLNGITKFVGNFNVIGSKKRKINSNGEFQQEWHVWCTQQMGACHIGKSESHHVGYVARSHWLGAPHVVYPAHKILSRTSHAPPLEFSFAHPM